MQRRDHHYAPYYDLGEFGYSWVVHDFYFTQEPKVGEVLFDGNGVSEPQLPFSTISGVFERVRVWLHGLLMI